MYVKEKKVHALAQARRVSRLFARAVERVDASHVLPRRGEGVTLCHRVSLSHRLYCRYVTVCLLPPFCHRGSTHVMELGELEAVIHRRGTNWTYKKSV